MLGSLPARPHCSGDLLANSSVHARYEKFHLCWVPHALDMNQKAERVTLSCGILSVFPSVRSTDFRNIIAGDESWFFLYYLRDSIWASSRDEVPERASQKLTQKSV
jgi:hypothetical protein